MLYDLKRLEAAQSSYRKAIEIRPDQPYAHFALGNVLYDLKKPGEALGAYRKAVALRPDDALPYRNLGTVLYDLKRLDEALGAYRTAIELQPDDAYAHHGVGNVLYDLRKLDEALGAYRKAIAPSRTLPILTTTSASFCATWENSMRRWLPTVKPSSSSRRLLMPISAWARCCTI